MYHLLKMMTIVVMNRVVGRYLFCWYKYMDVVFGAWTLVLLKVINGVVVGMK
jgi:hypothetical protein